MSTWNGFFVVVAFQVEMADRARVSIDLIAKFLQTLKLDANPQTFVGSSTFRFDAPVVSDEIVRFEIEQIFAGQHFDQNPMNEHVLRNALNQIDALRA